MSKAKSSKKNESSLEIARGYLKRGWLPVPIPLMSKDPSTTAGKGWQNLRLTEETIDQHFGNGPMNIGVLLGLVSKGLTDVDLDWLEAILLAPKYLPKTKTFGREHARMSHRLYNTDLDETKGYIIKVNDKLEKIVELRASGQTVFPGSLYKGDEKGNYRGEKIRWDDGDDVEVLKIDGNELRKRVGKLAAAAYLLHVWQKTVRDEIAFALIGTLIRKGWDVAEVDEFIGIIVTAAHDEEAAQRFKAETVKVKLDSGKGRVKGIPSLKTALGADKVDKLLEWLGLADEESEFFSGRTFKPPKLRDYVAERHELFHDGIGFNLYLPEQGYFKATNDDILKEIMAEVLKDRATSHHVQDALNLLEYKVFKDPEEIPRYQNLVNLKNGMLDIRTMELLLHDKKYFSRAQIPFDYDPTAKCPEWDKFLKSTFIDDVEKIKAAQDFAGYCLCPTSFLDKALFCWGGGGNGKNVFSNTLDKLLGSQNCSAFDWTAFSNKFMITELRNKLLNVGSEIETESKLSTKNFKNIASGDRVEGEVKYVQKPVSFIPSVKLIFHINQPPIITDHTDAFKRRVYVIGFNQKFEDKTDIKEYEQRFDPELSGILNWALVGLARVLEAKKLHESPTMKLERERFLKTMNPMLHFIEERIMFEETARLGHQEFFNTYRTWCYDNGLRPKGKIHLFEDFHTAFPTIKDDTFGANKFMGIRFKTWQERGLADPDEIDN